MKCVRCSAEVRAQTNNCSSCTWPFTLAGWRNSASRIERLTLDTGCINAKGRDDALNTLERWRRDGLLQLQRSDVMLEELTGAARIAKAESLAEHPGVFVIGKSAIDSPDVFEGPDLGTELQKLLFPTTQSLTNSQEHDVAHLRLHILRGGDVFVTRNRNDFITRGRQEALRICGVWVMEPEEIVELLSGLYGWR